MQYRLILDVLGDGYRDRVTITADDPKDLESTWQTHDGLGYEKFGDDDEWIEIRSSMIVQRKLEKVEDEDPRIVRTSARQDGGSFGSIIDRTPGGSTAT